MHIQQDLLANTGNRYKGPGQDLLENTETVFESMLFTYTMSLDLAYSRNDVTSIELFEDSISKTLQLITINHKEK